MKTFDEQLEAAFEAGELYALSNAALIEEDKPSFEEWRAALSGLNLVPHADLLTEAELERACQSHHEATIRSGRT